MSNPVEKVPEKVPVEGRRAFLKEAAAGVVGGCCLLVPAGAGLVAWLDPLSQQSGGGGWVRVAALSALPADGAPRRVTVVSERRDGWTREPEVPLGAIYLRRTGERSVQALHSVCPHAGCFVDYRPEPRSFFCPCHDSTFAVDGSINDPRSPSPRAMDGLEVELKGDEVWVRFVQFRTGIKEKVVVS
jgi:menaquinol-cytochrome c reductase iron-sulfur subunit